MHKGTFAAWSAISAFGLNYLWEMLQMPFFAGMSFLDWQAWIFCLVATLGDVVMIMVILLVGRWVFGCWEWAVKLNGKKVLYLVIAGASLAVIAEIVGLMLGYWQYSSLMPAIPWLGIGLVPFMQMLILPIASYKVAHHLLYNYYKV